MSIESPNGSIDTAHTRRRLPIGKIGASVVFAAEATYGGSMVLGKNIPGSGEIVRIGIYLPDAAMRTVIWDMSPREAVGTVLVAGAGALLKKTFFPRIRNTNSTE